MTKHPPLYCFVNGNVLCSSYLDALSSLLSENTVQMLCLPDNEKHRKDCATKRSSKGEFVSSVAASVNHFPLFIRYSNIPAELCALNAIFLAEKKLHVSKNLKKVNAFIFSTRLVFTLAIHFIFIIFRMIIPCS